MLDASAGRRDRGRGHWGRGRGKQKLGGSQVEAAVLIRPGFGFHTVGRRGLAENEEARGGVYRGSEPRQSGSC